MPYSAGFVGIYCVNYGMETIARQLLYTQADYNPS